MAAVVSRRLLRPGSSAGRIEDSEASRACALPTAAEIELACETVEAVPIPGSRSPDDPDTPNYSFPDHRVTGAQCSFADAGASRADCAFEIAVAGAPSGRARAELVYRFRDLSNAVAHDYWATIWEVDSVCRPETGLAARVSR